jgi:hypothetical protein
MRVGQGRPTVTRRTQHALGSLDATERAVVLDALLHEHPELLDRAEQLATDHLQTIDSEEIAEEVVWALQGIPPEEVGNRSGRQPGRGCVEPDQVVWELLEETIQPYLRDITRRVGLGMSHAALKIGLGVLAGLYECRLDPEDGSVLAWAPADEAMPELASEVMSVLAASEVTVPARALDELP